MADVDFYLKLDGITGEAQDPDHTEEIEILSWSWGVSNTASFASGSTGGAFGRASLSDLSFMHYVDNASTALAQKCANGDTIGTGKLTCRKGTGDNKLDYLAVDLEDVMVTSVQTSGSGGGGAPVSESFSLTFRKITTTYKGQSNPGDAAGGATFSWDVQQHQS